MAVQSAYRDAERTNNSYRAVKQYKDLNLNFTRHPITKDISPITDAVAVKRSVRNLIQYNYFEKKGSAQCKSSVILAALNTPGKTIVTAKKSRNHTELFLKNLRAADIATFNIWARYYE